MAKKSGKAIRRHTLLIYYRLGQRWRTIPLLLVLLGLTMLALGWLADSPFLQEADLGLLSLFWTNWPLIVGLIVLSLMLFLLATSISRGSYVEVRPRALHIRAGLIPMDISYGRIKQVRLVALGSQHPPERLRGADRALIEPLAERSCTAVDLNSWPMNPQTLKRLWSKFMFTADGGSLLLLVRDAMVLNQQIDSARAAYHARLSKQSRGYKDPIERAVEAARKQRR